MRDYFNDGDDIIAYDNPKNDLSYQEIYKIYNPVKYVLEENIKEHKKKLAALQTEIDAMKDRLALTVPYADLDFCVVLASIPLQRERDYYIKLIELNEGIIRLIEGIYNAERVMMIPMTDFITFNKMGFARCPFHDEKTASFRYYKRDNRAHCFGGCGQKNVVQVYAQLKGIGDREAFTELKNRLV